MTINYTDANVKLEELKQAYIELAREIDTYYLKPGLMIKVPIKLNALIERENALSRDIKASNLNPVEVVTLRQKYSEVQEEFRKAKETSIRIEKKLFGMQTKDQQNQTKTLSSEILNPVTILKKMRLIVETTDLATPKTKRVLKETLVPAFKGSNEFKKGEVTINLEEEA